MQEKVTLWEKIKANKGKIVKGLLIVGGVGAGIAIAITLKARSGSTIIDVIPEAAEELGEVVLEAVA